MLEIFGSIISGFAHPIKPEHVTFLRKVLMPLHGTEELETYHPQLAYCVLQFVSKSAGPSVDAANGHASHVVSEIVLNGLLRYWPKCNSTKEVMFMNEFEEVIDALSYDAFAQFRTVSHLTAAFCPVRARIPWGAAVRGDVCGVLRSWGQKNRWCTKSRENSPSPLPL